MVPEETGAAPSTQHDREIDFRNHRELLEANLQRQIEAIRAADFKIALLVPTSTVMLGIFASLLRSSAPDAQHMLWAVLCAIPLIVAFVLMAGGIIPRLRSNPSRSLLFFGDLAAQDHAAARDAMLAMTTQGYLADLAGQCHTNASIARTKHRSVRRAYLAFLLALPFWLSTFWVLSGD